MFGSILYVDSKSIRMMTTFDIKKCVKRLFFTCVELPDDGESEDSVDCNHSAENANIFPEADVRVVQCFKPRLTFSGVVQLQP